MSEELAVLEVQIPIFEAKLAAMKRKRKSLKASAAMHARRLNPAMEAVRDAGFRHYWNSPEGRAERLQRHNVWVLPWPRGSHERCSYQRLKSRGRTRKEAIAEVNNG